MQKIYRIFFIGSAILISNSSFGQDSTKTKSLNEVVVTGQYSPQTLKKSVYRVRVINSERIKLSGAVNIQQVLNNQLGVRFATDQFLGTDIQLNGMSGRNVKILLDGVPVLDRFDARVSLSQIDVNTIERIEIVEGPMSVSYGTDAMAGVINIITKKNNSNNLSVSARAQEESAGSEYYPFSYQGVHNQNINIGLNKNAWDFNIGGSHNDFDGFGGDQYGRGKSWLPKEQWLGNGKIGYRKNGFHIYYRLDAMKETISDRNPINIDADAPFAEAIDQKFITERFMHQLQGGYHFNNRLELSSYIAYTDFKRSTSTDYKDFIAHTITPGTAEGQQDVSKLSSFSFKNTLQYIISDKFSLQPGIDINHEKASGARISGTPQINDYALFVSTEYKPTSKISLRPGLRFEKNSVYTAPPAIPSLNTKFILNKNLDLRLAYGYGFRAPELRELYFLFKDVNHDIVGNQALKAETSNSFNGSLEWTAPHIQSAAFSTVLGAYYNLFQNQINLLQIAPPNGQQYTYFNIDKVKTTGFSIDNHFVKKNLDATLGFSYTGFDREYPAGTLKNVNRNFLWTPEFNSNIIYRLRKIKTSLGLFYKYTGQKPAFSENPTTAVQGSVSLTKTNAYNLADFTVTTAVHKYFSLSVGVKNIFDVTNVKNTTIESSNVQHSSGGALGVNYGRSYFAGLVFQWNKK